MCRQWSFLYLMGFLIFGGFSCEETSLDRPFAQLQTIVLSVDENGVEVEAKIEYIPEDAPIVEYGFAYGPLKEGLVVFPDPNGDTEFYLLAGQLNGESFTAKLDRALIKDRDYYVRAYIRSEDWVAYGSEKRFLSQGAPTFEVKGLWPNDTIVAGQTLTILGENMGNNPDGVQVLLNNKKQPIQSISDTAIQIQVPHFYRDWWEFEVRSSFGDEVFTPSFPHVPNPVITSLTPRAFADGDTLTIRGRYFSPVPEWNEAKIFINPDIKRITSNENEIKLWVRGSNPPFGRTFDVVVGVGFLNSEAYDLSYARPEIYDFTPKEGMPGDTVTIIGNNFHGEPGFNTVVLNIAGPNWNLVKQSYDTLLAIVPKIAINPEDLPLRASLSVTSNGAGSVATKDIFSYQE